MKRSLKPRPTKTPARLEVHFYHHFVDEVPGGANRDLLTEILALAKTHTLQGRQIMSKLDDLNAELVAANEQSNAIADALAEVGSDIDDLIAKLAAGGLSAEEADAVKAKIVELKDTLAAQAAAAQAIAAKHTP